MSWSKSSRAVLAIAMLSTTAILAGCSGFRPVYGGALAANPTLSLAYAEPNSRLEQIIYQELALRLGKSTAPTAPQAKVSVSTSGSAPGNMSDPGGPNDQARVTVTATLTITSPGQSDPVVLSRTATAQYTTNSQVLANISARDEASERAARSAAESLRLAVLASLGGQ